MGDPRAGTVLAKVTGLKEEARAARQTLVTEIEGHRASITACEEQIAQLDAIIFLGEKPAEAAPASGAEKKTRGPAVDHTADDVRIRAIFENAQGDDVGREWTNKALQSATGLDPATLNAGLVRLRKLHVCESRNRGRWRAAAPPKSQAAEPTTGAAPETEAVS
jgi:hypothetical protein